MRKSVFLLTFLLILSVTPPIANAAAPSVNVSSRYGSTAYDWAKELKFDSQGNFYIVGISRSSSISFGNSITFTNSSNTGFNEGFLVKFNSAGTAQWVKAFAGVDNESLEHLSIDSADNIYVTGTFDSNSSSIGGQSLSNSTGGTAGMLAKFNSAGTLAWVKNLGQSGTGYTVAPVIDSSLNVYVATALWWSTTFAGTSVTLISTKDTLVGKFNSSGTLQWIKQSSNLSLSDAPVAIGIDSSGNVYVAGTANGNMTIGGSTLSHSAGSDFYLFTMNASGTVVRGQFVGSGGGATPVAISVLPSGKVIIGGRVSAAGAVLAGVTITSAGLNDIFIISLNADGTSDWVSHFGGTGSEDFSSLVTDSSGNIYIAGQLGGSVSFGSTTLTTTSYVATHYLAQLNSSGDAVWAKRIGVGTPSGALYDDFLALNEFQLFQSLSFYGNFAEIDATRLTTSVSTDIDFFYARYTIKLISPVLTALQYSTSIKKGAVNPVSITASVPGKFTFYANGRKIPRCIAVTATLSGATYSATCNWKPSLNGSISVSAAFKPNSADTYSSASTMTTANVIFRTNKR